MDTRELKYSNLRNGYWSDKANDIPVVLERVPDNIYDLDRLWINIGTIGGLNEKDRKMAKKQWIKVLPILKDVKYLWIKGNVNQDLFDVICQIPNLECLFLEWTSIKKTDGISNLSKLLHLHIGSSSKIEDINSISDLSNLITLQMEGLKLISTISPIMKLKNLEGLYINGDMWKKQIIQTLKGIENLQNLKYLSLDGTEVIEKDVEPVTKLVKLIRLELGYWWTKEDFQLLYKALPLLKFGGVKEAVESGEYEKYLRKAK